MAVRNHSWAVQTLINPQGVVNLGVDCAPHSCVSWWHTTYPGVLQAVRKEIATARPPVDNNQDYTQNVTTWNSVVGHLILTDLMLELFNTSTLHLSLDLGD